jgi:hypothetical protein
MEDGSSGMQSGEPHDGVPQELMHIAPVSHFCDAKSSNQGHRINEDTTKERQWVTLTAQR